MLLHGPRLDLVPCDLPRTEALAAGPDTFLRQYGWRLEPGYLEFPEALDYLLALHRANPGGLAWNNYLFVLREAQTVTGLGGFKGGPDAAGCVEIGYGVAPAFRGRGLATEAARLLLRHAWSDPAVRTVIAHTLPEPNASNAILRKLGLAFAGELNDPDDGLVWRWALHRAGS